MVTRVFGTSLVTSLDVINRAPSRERLCLNPSMQLLQDHSSFFTLAAGLAAVFAAVLFFRTLATNWRVGTSYESCGTIQILF